MLLVSVFLHRPTRNCPTPGNDHAMLFKSKLYFVVRLVRSRNYYRWLRPLKMKKKVEKLGWTKYWREFREIEEQLSHYLKRSMREPSHVFLRYSRNPQYNFILCSYFKLAHAPIPKKGSLTVELHSVQLNPKLYSLSEGDKLISSV